MIPTYDIVPGSSIGLFHLGDTLWHVLDTLRTHKTEYPKFELSWDPDHPHNSATTIHLPQITLYFPPSPTQQLTLISLPSIPTSGLTLTYETQVLSSPTQPLTRARVGRILGPTFASTSGKKLEFPGISFDLAPSPGGAGGGREDVVQSLTITSRDGEAKEPRLVACQVQPNKGVTLTLSGEEDKLDIVIGETTSQDLLLDLGAPLRKFWKEDDRLERMWGGVSQPGGCFWNYFQYGLDFLISGEGIVLKILCHSNIPGTPLFQRYARCPWTLSTPSSSLDLTSSTSAFRSHLSSKSSSQYTDEIHLIVPTPPVSIPSAAGGKKGKKKNGSSSPASSGADTPDLGKSSNGRVGDDPPDAMVLDRVVEGGLEGVIGVGPSRLLGFDGLIIEEDQTSGGICSVLVWRDEDI
ncbi:hypothetical protein CI109_101690 [Kwoniella shandongensis]|uniref:Uncharacterized protein n=1 Tax=Kwoniella shandongensis TaxID=1734106 RepID=A0A5M6C5V1_9TREE|nr:uncharacterized protein CI109_001186 [Kwoniella shandongensis]KAA5530383.1 hypothetical protein CI109_001186 [Kwoniella shandongensis]